MNQRGARSVWTHGMGQSSFPPFFGTVDNALMTFPRADNDLLIFWASFKVSPEAPVFPTRSDPARSISVNLAPTIPREDF